MYLNEFLDCATSWETWGTSLEISSSGYVSKVGFGYVPPTSEHLASEPLASEHSASEGVIAFDPPTFGETYDIWNSGKIFN